MLIAATSDLHGHLVDTPECDVLIIAGDLGPATQAYHHNPIYGFQWLQLQFIPWCISQPARHIVVIAGNHDYVLEQVSFPSTPDNIHYLQDSGVEIEGIKFWGSPWTPQFFDWAFMNDDYLLAQRWDLIPPDTDVLVTHAPPYGLGDQTSVWERCGSQSLRYWRDNNSSLPALHVFGHIHEGMGQKGENWANVSLLNGKYQVKGDFHMVELDGDK